MSTRFVTRGKKLFLVVKPVYWDEFESKSTKSVSKNAHERAHETCEHRILENYDYSAGNIQNSDILKRH